MDRYIQQLTNKNIENLCFPDLYKGKVFEDNYSINNISLHELSTLKQKIINFTFKQEILDNMSNIIYEEIDVKLFIKKQFINMTNDLIEMYGSYDDFKYKDVELKGENKLTKEQQIRKFKKILEYNIHFILNNKQCILDRIEEVYNIKNKEIADALKEKQREYMKEYNARDDIKNKRKEYCDEKITCECGLVTARKHLARHKDTSKHNKLLRK